MTTMNKMQELEGMVETAETTARLARALGALLHANQHGCEDGEPESFPFVVNTANHGVLKGVNAEVMAALNESLADNDVFCAVMATLEKQLDDARGIEPDPGGPWVLIVVGLEGTGILHSTHPTRENVDATLAGFCHERWATYFDEDDDLKPEDFDTNAALIKAFFDRLDEGEGDFLVQISQLNQTRELN